MVARPCQAASRLLLLRPFASTTAFVHPDSNTSSLAELAVRRAPFWAFTCFVFVGRTKAPNSAPLQVEAISAAQELLRPPRRGGRREDLVGWAEIPPLQRRSP